MTLQQKPNKSDKLNKDEHIQYRPKKSMTLDDYPKIEGYNFEKPLDFNDFIKSFSRQGFQGTNLGKGIEIIKTMQREGAKIFLTYTSNQVTCGNRDIIKFLVKNKKVDVLVTSAGGIEEDIIKCLKPFVLGDFKAPGNMLFENGINRTGNIFVPNDRYTYFDKFMKAFLDKLWEEGKKSIAPFEFNKKLGLAINNEESILYWAAKNDIPVFCPGIVDGAIGDLLVFFKQRRPEFKIDVTDEVVKITNITLNSEKTGGIILGGGISKHFALNANIFREGFDYVVYVNTAQEFDGSDSGARVDEAITWGKVKTDAPSVKIHCDASIAFPLLVAGMLSK